MANRRRVQGREGHITLGRGAHGNRRGRQYLHGCRPLPETRHLARDDARLACRDQCRPFPYVHPARLRLLERNGARLRSPRRADAPLPDARRDELLVRPGGQHRPGAEAPCPGHRRPVRRARCSRVAGGSRRRGRTPEQHCMARPTRRGRWPATGREDRPLPADCLHQAHGPCA